MHLKSVAGSKHEYLKIVMEVDLNSSTCTVVVVIDHNSGEFLLNKDSHNLIY